MLSTSSRKVVHFILSPIFESIFTNTDNHSFFEQYQSLNLISEKIHTCIGLWSFKILISNNYVFFSLSPADETLPPNQLTLRSGWADASSLGIVCGFRSQLCDGIIDTTMNTTRYGYNRVYQGKTYKQSGSSMHEFRRSGWTWQVCLHWWAAPQWRGAHTHNAFVGPYSSESPLVREVTLLERGLLRAQWLLSICTSTEQTQTCGASSLLCYHEGEEKSSRAVQICLCPF